jgi:hypothetical protein
MPKCSVVRAVMPEAVARVRLDRQERGGSRRVSHRASSWPPACAWRGARHVVAARTSPSRRANVSASGLRTAALGLCTPPRAFGRYLPTPLAFGHRARARWHQSTGSRGRSSAAAKHYCRRLRSIGCKVRGSTCSAASSSSGMSLVSPVPPTPAFACGLAAFTALRPQNGLGVAAAATAEVEATAEAVEASARLAVAGRSTHGLGWTIFGCPVCEHMAAACRSSSCTPSPPCGKSIQMQVTIPYCSTPQITSSSLHTAYLPQFISPAHLSTPHLFISHSPTPRLARLISSHPSSLHTPHLFTPLISSHPSSLHAHHSLLRSGIRLDGT